MTKETEIDVMSSLLSDTSDDEIPEVEQLNCLIFSDLNDPFDADMESSEADSAWKTENDKLTIQVWETSGRVRIKVSPKPKTRISVKHLGEIALNAIMKELEKDSS
ncbi:hypothetical protein [Motiliproteus sp. MSK22-1]|uniref:hypothetical protein n=1 Tax=Motiliproteus sp. MSK22-1 TaxID=1897630 RepID=UPI000977348F|nr:hypothetical protein [Motiliproteus sp. MSK22-1]OMH25578.1 hypothetical protein BGP75_23790 [Motiliproteus sp. MSK22-1]